MLSSYEPCQNLTTKSFLADKIDIFDICSELISNNLLKTQRTRRIRLTGPAATNFHCHQYSKASFPIPIQEHTMSAPSRRPEIRRRRTRKQKIVQLRKRPATAQNDRARNRLTANPPTLPTR